MPPGATIEEYVSEFDRLVEFASHTLDGFDSLMTKFSLTPVVAPTQPTHTPARQPQTRSIEVRHVAPPRKPRKMSNVKQWAMTALVSLVAFETGFLAFLMVDPW